MPSAPALARDDYLFTSAAAPASAHELSRSEAWGYNPLDTDVGKARLVPV